MPTPVGVWWAFAKKILDHFSICACHPCAGAMLIFSVSFQFYRVFRKISEIAGVLFMNVAIADLEYCGLTCSFLAVKSGQRTILYRPMI
jgi:hypothetical protein